MTEIQEIKEEYEAMQENVKDAKGDVRFYQERLDAAERDLKVVIRALHEAISAKRDFKDEHEFLD